jgi:hypothetical protein
MIARRAVQYELRAPDDVTVWDAPRTLTFTLDEDSVHAALETVVKLMHPGEVCRVDVSRRTAHAHLTPPPPNVCALLPTLPLPSVQQGESDAALEAVGARMYVTLTSVQVSSLLCTRMRAHMHHCT